MSDAVGTCSVVKRCCKYDNMRFVLPTFSSPTTTHLIALPDFFWLFFVFFATSTIGEIEKKNSGYNHYARKRNRKISNVHIERTYELWAHHTHIPCNVRFYFQMLCYHILEKKKLKSSRTVNSAYANVAVQIDFHDKVVWPKRGEATEKKRTMASCEI